MKKLTSVLIGCGKIASAHLDALGDLNNVDVAAVCDLSAVRAEATAERFGVKRWYSNYSQMLADIKPDLVHITTPPSSHFPLAKDCLDAGLNVLCEKPIVTDYQDFVALKQLAAKNRCVLMENQNLRFHNVMQRIDGLRKAGQFGDILDVQVCFSINIVGPDSPYADPNVPHYGTALRGGVIGDFLTHMAYLAYVFTGPVQDLRTIWAKHTIDSELPADEFRCVIKGERATAYVAFSGNAQPEAYWLRISGTRMYAEANLSEPRRLTLRRLRKGEPALMRLADGCTEARDVMSDAIASFWSKLGGASHGLSELIARTYKALELQEAQPIALDEIDDIARLVHNFTTPEFKL
jgi:predicted dehydrogenase